MADTGAGTGELTGTVAIVTGASSGIGEATAVALAGEGATVVLAARRADRLADLAGRIAASGSPGGALARPCDVTDEDQARALVEETVSRFGRLDTLVNNAGVMLLGPARGAPFAEWRRMVDLNLMALLACTHAAVPYLVAAAAEGPRGVADVVNVSSVAGRVARSGSAVYNATKFGVGAFSEALRQELASSHVRVGLVEPGATITELATHLRPEVRHATVGRFAGVTLLEAADVADAVRYLVTRPRHVAVNELLVRPAEQEG